MQAGESRLLGRLRLTMCIDGEGATLVTTRMPQMGTLREAATVTDGSPACGSRGRAGPSTDGDLLSDVKIDKPTDPGHFRPRARVLLRLQSRREWIGWACRLALGTRQVEPDTRE